jgi:hypothetical protein
MKIRGTETTDELPKKKRGRPPKNAAAMTPAERKAASRMNRKQKEQDAEREKIITTLMKMYGRPRQEFELRNVSTEALRMSLESTPVETRGRLPGERQTEEKKLERIAVASKVPGRRVRPSGAGPDS